MKHTIKPSRKAPRLSARSKLLAAGSAVAIFAVSGALVAQTAGERIYSGGYATSGIPVTDDAYGTVSQTGPIAPTGIGANGARPGVLERNAPVRRGRWTTQVTPFVEGAVSYSDNINLDPDGFEQDETVLTTTAGVNVAIQSDRLSGQVSASLSYDKYLNDTNDDGLRGNLDTGWSAAIVPNLLYLDVGAGVSEVFIDNDDRFSGNPLANSDDRTRAYYGLISPSLRKNIGGWANAELRYTARGEAYESGDIDGGLSHTVSAGLSSDPRKFRRFGWAALTEYEDYNPESDDENLRRWTSQVSLDVPVSRTLAVTASAGYDHFSENVNDDFAGAYGNVGLRFQPNQRLSGQVFAGYRYGGADYGAQVNYAAQRNLVASLSASRSVQFSNYDDDDALRTELNGANGGIAANLNPTFAIQDEDAIVDTVAANVAGSVGKTGWTAGVTALHRDFNSNVFENETVVSANLGATRALTNRLSAELGAGYSRYTQDGSSIDDFDTLALGAGLSYQLTEIVNVFGRYTYTERFADESVDEFKENAGTVGVTASF
jgi:hypothetical protein